MRIRRYARAGCFFLALLSVAPAQAGLTESQLRTVGVFPPRGAILPAALAFRDANGNAVTIAQALGGTPAIVLFTDFACKTLCGPILTMTSAALVQTGLAPGGDFHLLVIGMRANATASQARAFVAPQLAPRLAGATRILLGDARAIAAATHALGYRYAYDAQNDQFAHPTAAFVIARSGKLNAVLSALGLSGTDLRLALVSAGAGGGATIVDRLRLLCYCYDPQTGIYSASIGRLIDAAAFVTVLMLGGGLYLLRRRERTARPT
ncbi:MAG: SCO family protein [Rhizomicrobium sp.]